MLVNQILAMKASDEIVTIRPTATVTEAARVLGQKRIGAVVVSDDGKTALGILSERDIVRALDRDGSGVMDKPISDLMTHNISTCHTGDDALAILERMTEGRFRHMPVVSAEGEMIGLISIGDVVSARLKQLSAEHEALTGMIMGS